MPQDALELGVREELVFDDDNNEVVVLLNEADAPLDVDGLLEVEVFKVEDGKLLMHDRSKKVYGELGFSWKLPARGLA
jgi:hypothetical protein